jgi:pimeloyl-ACP methyl ester carboxylesterase
MSLEILHAKGRGKSRPFDLLLVHGIFVGAWVWEEHFMPHLADAGYDVHALSLSGHGESCGRDRLMGLTLQDYASDMREAVAKIDRPVVAIGHSMGGAVVQGAIRNGVSLSGAALLASVPPGGLMAANFAMMFSQPTLWRELSGMFTGLADIDVEVLRDGLFSNRVDQKTFAKYMERGGLESSIVGLELQGLIPFAPMPWQAPPMLVAGGSEDRLIRREDLWSTGMWYGSEPVVLPGLSHSVMLDPDWKIAADALLGWLEFLEAKMAQNQQANTEPADAT